MPIKSILCVYGGVAFEQNALDTTLSLAGFFQAEARFLHISVPLNVYPELYGITLYGQAVSGDVGVLDSIAEANEEQRKIAQTAVISAARAHGVAFSRKDCLGTTTGTAMAVFCPVTARLKDCLPQAGRLADLIIVPRERANAVTDLEAVLCGLFDTGRPVLVVPSTDTASAVPAAKSPFVTGKAAIAWDGSLPAARALYNALPFLRRAKQIEVICVRHAHADAETDYHGDLSHWLDLHELPAHIHRIDREATTVGAAILDRAETFEAEWLVMGAYGHSHVGEMILGGATNYVLKHSRMPLLLSH